METDPSTAPPTSPPPPKPSSRTRQLLMVVGVVIVVGAAAYLLGLFQGRAAVSDLEAQLEQTQQALTRAEAQGQLQEALGLLYQSAMQLDARNFGTANERLDAAAATLQRATAAGTADVQALQQRVAALDLEVAADLDGQRRQVLAFAEQLRALLAETP